jgi:uncharacterized protein (TIGR02285 family)
MFLSFALIFALILPIVASAKDTILWQTYHRPPGTFNYGENKGQGFVQKTLQMIIDRMPEYQHEMPVTTLARAISDIKAGHKVCHPALYVTPERRKYMVFSDASILNPNNRIIAKPETVAPFLKNNQVNLEHILQQDILSFGHVKNRSYGNVIDNIFTKYNQTKNVVPLQNIDLTRVFKMIEIGRVELTIAYPFEIQHYLNESPKTAEQLQAYSITNIAPYDIGSVACPNNEWGKKITEQVNKILKEIKPTVAYQEALTTWREGERDSKLFKNYYRDYFLKH